MKPGSVIVDLAASTGGNCELTENGKIIQVHGVTIIGDSGLASTMPYDASKMFGKHHQLLKIMIDKEGNINLNWEDDLITGTCISYQQEIKTSE